jgi:deoxycytidylate deaminase
MQKDLELFFGLVGPVGTDLDQVSAILKSSLRTVGFNTEIISLSDLLHQVDKFKKKLVFKNEYERITRHMNAGNLLRQTLEMGDALALMAVRVVLMKRIKKTNNEKPFPRTAFIFKSLKHPDEAKTLRLIYGKSFHLISVNSPRTVRHQNMANRIKGSVHAAHVDRFTPYADALLVRDESEADVVEFGQNVRETYPFGDLFVNAGDTDRLKKDLNRYVELLFGNSLHTPMNEEYGMFNAFASAKRSGSLARQVGAIITNDRGDVIAAGMNEVPKFNGGQFVEGDQPIHRNIELGYDPSDVRRYELLVDILKALRRLGLLKSTDDPVDIAKKIKTQLKDAQFMSLIEFTTEVHAEMAAITTAARNTISIEGASMFTTTFPCHDCTKHLIAAGITKVVYMEPYPKSLAKELFPKLISVDEEPMPSCKVIFKPFVGVAPSRFLELFTMGKRKDKDGKKVDWNPKKAEPIFYGVFGEYKLNELHYVEELDDQLRAKKLKLVSS